MCCSACHPGQKHALYSNEFNILIFSSATILFLPSSEIWLIPRGISLIAWQNPLFPGFSIGVHQKTGTQVCLQEVADAEKGSFEVTALHQWGSVWMWSKRFFDPQKIGCHFKNIWVCPKLRHTAKFEWFNHQELHCFWVQILGMPQVDALCHRRRTWQAFHKHWQSVRHRHLQQEANANWWGIGVNNPRKGSNWVTRMYSYV